MHDRPTRYSSPSKFLIAYVASKSKGGKDLQSFVNIAHKEWKSMNESERSVVRKSLKLGNKK